MHRDRSVGEGGIEISPTRSKLRGICGNGAVDRRSTHSGARSGARILLYPTCATSSRNAHAPATLKPTISVERWPIARS